MTNCQDQDSVEEPIWSTDPNFFVGERFRGHPYRLQNSASQARVGPAK